MARAEAAGAADFEDGLRPDIPRAEGGAGAPELRLGAWEGPLDLLLELARARKVDLQRLSITDLVEQFGAALEAAAGRRRVPLPRLGDWLVMAAHLALLRSRLVLPACISPNRSAPAVSASAPFRSRSPVSEVGFDVVEPRKKRLEFEERPGRRLPSTKALKRRCREPRCGPWMLQRAGSGRTVTPERDRNPGGNALAARGQGGGKPGRLGVGLTDGRHFTFRRIRVP